MFINCQSSSERFALITGALCRAVDSGQGPGFGLGLNRGRLPLRFGWLMGVMPYEAAGYASQLRTVLAEPEMAALVAALPQARRILGPLCRMLGVAMAPVRPPGVARAADGVADGAAQGEVPARPPTSRPAAARVRRVVDVGRIPLPRGVLAAARRQGFGKSH